jgi:ankyrin repeat protein
MKRIFFIVCALSICTLSLVLALPAHALDSTSLASAIQERTLRSEYILELLSHGANSNIKIDGAPLVVYVTMKLVRRKTADEQKWYAILTSLLNHITNVDDLDTNGYTALMYAAYYGHYDAVGLLLAHNAQAGFYNAYGKSPLTLAQDGRASALTQDQKNRYTQIITLLLNYVHERP